jgi:hypothetical protein
MQDAVIAFEMLKDGGYLIFDDYMWFESKLDHFNTKIGIDSFVEVYRGRMIVIHSDY